MHAVKPSQRNLSLRWTLLAAFGAILILLLLTGGAAVWLFVARNERVAWQDRQVEAARSATSTVSSFLNEQRATLATLGSLGRAQIAGSPQVGQTLLRQNPALLELIRVDASGAVVAVAARDEALLGNPFTLNRSSWFQHALAGEPYLGNVQIAASDEPYLVLALPAADGDIVAARLRMQLLWDTVKASRFGKTGQLYLIDRAGHLIAHHDTQAVLRNTTIGDHPALATSVSGGEVWQGRYTNFQGAAVLAVALPLPGTDWLAITELAQAEATEASRTAGLLLGGGLLLFGGLTMGATTLLLQRQVFQPLGRIQSVADRIRNADLTGRVVISHRDEIGQVAQSFNLMADAIMERETALQQLAATLEQQVAERTESLRLQAEEQARLQIRIIHAQAAALAELATPLMPISDDILAVPLIGVLDATRMRQVLSTVLRGVEKSGARIVILDITGVPLIDAQIAQALLQSATAVRLLGAAVVITGIRPEVAQALVSLGVDLQDLMTCSTLQNGIAFALQRVDGGLSRARALPHVAISDKS